MRDNKRRSVKVITSVLVVIGIGVMAACAEMSKPETTTTGVPPESTDSVESALAQERLYQCSSTCNCLIKTFNKVTVCASAPITMTDCVADNTRVFDQITAACKAWCPKQEACKVFGTLEVQLIHGQCKDLGACSSDSGAPPPPPIKPDAATDAKPPTPTPDATTPDATPTPMPDPIPLLPVLPF